MRSDKSIIQTLPPPLFYLFKTLQPTIASVAPTYGRAITVTREQ